MSQHAVELTDENFEQEVIRYPGVVFVDSYAVWCGPCRAVSKHVEELSQEYAGRVKICKLDTDKNPRTADKYNIRSIPTFMVFVNGQKVTETKGARPKQALEALFKPYLTAAPPSQALPAPGPSMGGYEPDFDGDRGIIQRRGR